MCPPGRVTPTLLVVLPGASGRLPVLKRLQTVARICVLLPSSDHLRSEWAKPVVGDENSIEFPGSTTDLDSALAAVKSWLSASDSSRAIDGVMTYDDFGIELCAGLCESLGLPGTHLATAQMLKNKVQFRERCAEAGIPAARRRTLICPSDVDLVLADKEFRFPAVLKPVKGGGSWHVRKVENCEELTAVWRTLSAEMSGGSFPAEIREAGFTLEEYFAGCEVDVDGWARNGKVEFCVVADNRPALEPHFLELGGIYPSQLPAPAVKALEQLTADVVNAFPGIHTAFHFEAKVNVDTLEVMPLEFNARTGGAECPASVEAITGYYLPLVAAELALDIPCRRSAKQYEVVASTNLYNFTHGRLTECNDRLVNKEQTNLVTSVLHAGSVGQTLVPNNGSQSCLGWMACGGACYEEAEQMLEAAKSQLSIVVTPCNESLICHHQ